jgi:hypothetical protein
MEVGTTFIAACLTLPVKQLQMATAFAQHFFYAKNDFRRETREKQE